MPPEKRHLLTTIDMIEFPKWELMTINDSSTGSTFKMWCDVLDIGWMCFWLQCQHI